MARIYTFGRPTGHVCSPNCPCNTNTNDDEFEALVARLIAERFAVNADAPMKLHRGVMDNDEPDNEHADADIMEIIQRVRDQGMSDEAIRTVVASAFRSVIGDPSKRAGVDNGLRQASRRDDNVVLLPPRYIK